MKGVANKWPECPYLAVVLTITQRAMCSGLFPRMVKVEVGESLRERPHGKSSGAGVDG